MEGTSQPTFEGHGIRGHLRLVCEPDSRGVPILREQSFRAPIHLSKPHLDADTLVLNVINPTAGLMEDDRIEQEITVRNGGRLLITCPSASRAHRVRNGWAAVSQTFRVNTGSFLEVLPEMFIPQAGAVYRQKTELLVEEGAELLLFESLAPGRVASGEAFQYSSLDWQTDLFIGRQQIVRERYFITPKSGSITALRRLFATAYYGSMIAVSPKLRADTTFLLSIQEMQSQQLWVGQTPLNQRNAISVKWVSENAMQLRVAQDTIRNAIYKSLGKQPPDLRRIVGR